VPASRAPWWLYIVAASFLGFFALQIYSYVRGPEFLDLLPDYSNGGLIVLQVERLSQHPFYPALITTRAN
jgi:hypothetical protein